MKFDVIIGNPPYQKGRDSTFYCNFPAPFAYFGLHSGLRLPDTGSKSDTELYDFYNLSASEINLIEITVK